MTGKRRLKPDDWIALGLSELAKRGPDAIKLEAICKAAGLTRGSFYHHFEDHNDFLRSMVGAWRLQSTENIIQNVDLNASADVSASHLTEKAIQIDYQLELGIRELARRLPEIADEIRETDQARLAILSEIYVARFGLEQQHAEDLAFLEYAAFSGITLRNPDMPQAKQQELAAKYDGLITQALTLR
jgi:AcrR family transcriptional regulator